MHRTLTSLAIAGIALVPLAACGSEGASTAAPATTVADAGARLPIGGAPEDVPVTRPADPRPVDVAQLPPTARGVAQLAGLHDDERTCATDAVARTLAADPALAASNGKVAGLQGNAVVACTTPGRLGDVVADGVGRGAKLPEDQRACVQRTVAAEPPAGGRFLAALLSADVPAVLAAAAPLRDACGIDLTRAG